MDYLSSIDGLESPDPDFAAELLDRLLEELADGTEMAPLRLVETDSVDLIVPDPVVPRPQVGRRSRILEIAAVLTLIAGGVFAFLARSQEGETILIETADEGEPPVGDADPEPLDELPTLVDLLADDERFSYVAALLETGAAGSNIDDCSVGREYTILAQTDASIDAYLLSNGLDPAVVFADPNVVSALLDDIVVDGAIPPPSGANSQEPVVGGVLLGQACNGVAYEVGGSWTPSDAASVALFDVSPELALAASLADDFMVARSQRNGSTLRSMIADDVLLRGEVGPVAAESYAGRTEFELVTNTDIVDHDCIASTPQLVRCTYTLASDLGRAQRSEAYVNNLVIFTIQGGEIQQIVNSIGNNATFIQDGEEFRSWLEQTHPDDLTVMMIGDGPLLSAALVLTDEAIALWQLRMPEYLEGTS